jgi:predicted esterase
MLLAACNDKGGAPVERTATSGAPEDPAPGREVETAEEIGVLTTKNAALRSGAYYLPPGHATQRLPLMLAYHGTDGSGMDMVRGFRGVARARAFIIVAPDSRMLEGHYNWEPGSHLGEVTADYTHAEACVAELRARTDVHVDQAHVLALGFSGGGSSAAYVASNDGMFSHIAVLHGGVINGGLGANRVRTWFSTGADDPLRPPSLVKESVDYVRSRAFANVVYKTYAGAHIVSPTELTEVVAWWLDRR